MLSYLNRKEKILTFLKDGLTNKGHSFKELSGINARLDELKDFKYRYSKETLNNLAESTNYSIVLDIVHGLDNINSINKKKNDWYLYAVNQTKMNDADTIILQESFLSNKSLIYVSEKSMSGEFIKFFVIFSKKKYKGSHEYLNQKWQG